MIKKTLFPALAVAACLGLSSCIADEYNFSDISTDNLALHTAIEGPIASTQISFEDFFDIDGVTGVLYTENGAKPVNEHVFQTLEFPLKLLKGSSLKLNKLIEDLDLSDMFGEEGFVTGLEKFKLDFTVCNNLPFNGSIIVKPVVVEDGVIMELPDKNAEHHQFELEYNEQNKVHSVIFDSSDVDLLQKSNALILNVNVQLTDEAATVRTSDFVSFYITSYISGKLLTNSL